MKKSFLLKMLALLLVVMLIAACARNGGNEAPPAGDAEEVTEEAAEEATEEVAEEVTEEGEIVDEVVEVEYYEPGEQVLIRYFHLWGDDPAQNYRHEPLARFLENNPHVTVEESFAAHDEFLGTMLPVLIAADELPEFFTLHMSHFVAAQTTGQLYDWTPALNADPEWGDAFLVDLFEEVATATGKYGLPSQMLAHNATFYNSEILASVGFDSFPEECWDTWMDMNQLLLDAGYIPVVMGNGAGWMGSSLLEVLIARTAGGEWKRSILDGTGTWEDPGVIWALELYLDIYNRGFFNVDSNSVDMVSSRQYYFQGLGAQYLEGSWTVGAFLEGPEEIINVTRIATLPEVAGGLGAPRAITGGCAWHYSASSRIAGTGALEEAVIALAKELTSLETAANMLEIGILPGINADLVTFDTSGLHPLYLSLYAMIANAGAVYPMHAVQTNSSVLEHFTRGIHELALGVITPEELAASTQQVYLDTYTPPFD